MGPLGIALKVQDLWFIGSGLRGLRGGGGSGVKGGSPSASGCVMRPGFVVADAGGRKYVKLWGSSEMKLPVV